MPAAVRELPAPSRLFLIFTGVNVVSWQCVVGPALVLFARAVAMPPALVGVLLSFMPLSMLLVLLAYPLVEWLGPRRLLFYSWLGRNLLLLPVFCMPWVMARWGEAAGWHLLLFATLGFSVIRAVGVGGWYPWLHEIVPRGRMGSYLALETMLSQAIAILLAFAMARVLAMAVGLERFLILYAVGVAAGLLSVLLIARIPGGAGLAGDGRDKYDPGRALGRVLADRGYLAFLALAVLGLSSLMWLNAAAVMYLRDVLRYSETHIMLLLAAGGVGVALSVRFWGRVADRFGSVPAMIQLLCGHALFALAWLGLLPAGRMTAALALPVLVFTTVFNAAFVMVAARGMLCRVHEEGRVGYTTLWILSVSVANGVPPILAGALIEQLGLAGFRLCFIIAGICGLAAAGLMFRLPTEEGKPPVQELHHLIRASQPLRSLGRVFWITLGLGDKRE